MFEKFPFLRATEFDVAEAVHDAAQMKLSLSQEVPRGGVIRTEANIAESADLGFYGYHYSHAVTLSAISENPHFWVAAPFFPNGLGAHKPICRPASPGDDDPMQLGPAADMLGMRLDGVRANRFVNLYLGEELSGPVRFEEQREYSSPADLWIAAKLSALSVARVDEVLYWLQPRNAQRLMEQTLEMLLLFRRHTYRGYVRRAGLAPAPRDVRRAVDFIHAHADTNPALGDIAAVAEVPGRTLSAHFKAYVGASPLAYVRRVRLQNVRRLLQNRSFDSVAEAANAQGFGHLGRFAGAYEAMFGEKPYQTLRRNRIRG